MNDWLEKQLKELEKETKNFHNDILEAHKHCSRNKQEIESSDICGCFYCMEIFKPEEIGIWLASDETALCPHCAIDSVIGSKSGFPITKEFLEKMHEYWF